MLIRLGALCVCVALGWGAFSSPNLPLALIKEIPMPDVPKGPYCDHLAVDLAGKRLFTTPQAQKSVDVFDLETGRLIKRIPGLDNPHSVLYRADVNRIYITDGGAGLLRVYDGKSYRSLTAIKLRADADSISYDPRTAYLYVTNGGKELGQKFAFLSVVDTNANKLLGDIRIEDDALEAMIQESASPRMYVNMYGGSQIAVVDRLKRSLIAVWPVTKGRKNIAMGIDEADHRLFVGCRNAEQSGVIIVLDTRSGKELGTLPIGGWVDYVTYDPRSKRIYASCGAPLANGGDVYVYQQDGTDKYNLLAKIPTAPRAKTGLLVPERNEFFVPVPHFESEARVLVFRTQ